MPPEGAASLLAPALMGYHRAFGLLVMGDQFDAHQAMHAGLVNRIVPADAVEAAGQDAARTLAAKPPEAVRMHRRLMRGDRLQHPAAHRPGGDQLRRPLALAGGA